MRSPDQYVESKTWMSNDIPVKQSGSFCRRTYQRANNTFSSSSGSFYDVSSTNGRFDGKTKSDSGVDADGVLFPIHG